MSIAFKGPQVEDIAAELAYQEYSPRIESLRSQAALEGSTVNEASERDFWSFVISISSPSKARLALMDNGNLRAIWKGDDESHLGLQFLGNQLAEYVIFKCRPSASYVSRVAGIDTLHGIKGQIDAFNLTSLVCV